MLEFLSKQSSLTLWMIFLIENIAVTGIALFTGWLILKLAGKPVKAASTGEWRICIVN